MFESSVPHHIHFLDNYIVNWDIALVVDFSFINEGIIWSMVYEAMTSDSHLYYRSINILQHFTFDI